MRIKKITRVAFQALIAVSLIQCGRKAPGIEKTMENGVEVVTNHLEPYSLPGVPSKLALEEIFSIDTEKEEIAKTGLTNMESFAVAPNGDIFIMMRESPGDFIYRFDGSGKFISSFGHKGQGPGEFEAGGNILIDEKNRIIAKDMTKEKFFIYKEDGSLVEEVLLEKNLSILLRLGKHEFLTRWQEEPGDRPVFMNHFYVSNDTLSENREIYNYDFDDPRRSPRYVPSLARVSILTTSGRNIFIADSVTDYEIEVLDNLGTPLRKIRKAFHPVAFPAEYVAILKESRKRSMNGQELLRKLLLPNNLPPFRYLFTDDRGRLYVMTHEREGERSYWYDIFSEEGVFIGRFKLDNVQVIYFEDRRFFDMPTAVLVKGDRLYYVRESPDGFMALAVYRMVWN